MNRFHKNIIFVLLSLIVLIVVAVIAANLGYFGQEAIQSRFAEWGLGAALAAIIGLFSYLIKMVFKSDLEREIVSRAYSLTIVSAGKIQESGFVRG